MRVSRIYREVCFVEMMIQSFHFIQVLSSDGTQEVGKITKQWSGLAKEYFTDADNFGMQCKPWVRTTVVSNSGEHTCG